MKMPNNSPNHLRGFTLVELLVVIAIIAVLIGLSAPAINGALKKAERVASQQEVLSIVQAVEGFKTDESVYPNLEAGNGSLTAVTGAGDYGVITDGTGDGTLLIKGLCGDDVTGFNIKGVQYLEGDSATATGTKGLHYGSGGSGSYSYSDKWGNAYEIYWDANYDDVMADPFTVGNEIRRGVIGVGRGTMNASTSLDTTDSKQQKHRVQTW